jgi:hypothetical protein
MNKSYLINKCQISNSKNLQSILNLGYLPPVNDFKKIGSAHEECKFYPTELLYCNESKLFQLGFVVSKHVLFPKSYPYTSSTTKILRDNFFDLSLKCRKKFNLKKNDLIVDIGSNDGNLLSYFKNFSRVLGVTPEEIGKIAIKKGIPTILKYFDNNVSKFILNKYGKAKIVTATNVFAHIDNPNYLTKNINSILRDDGVFISESHYVCPLIKNIQYDSIYHEHLRYYSLQSLSYLLKKNNLHIFDAEEIGTHGGSIRVYASKKKYLVTQNVKKILINEKKILKKKNIIDFKNRVIIAKLKLLKIIYKIKKMKNNISGISAPSRATTLINYTGLDENIIDSIFEIPGSYKIGSYLPGTKIPVLSEDNLFKIKHKQPDYLLLLSWHISEELIKNLKQKGYKGKFIIPLPEPLII